MPSHRDLRDPRYIITTRRLMHSQSYHPIIVSSASHELTDFRPAFALTSQTCVAQTHSNSALPMVDMPRGKGKAEAVENPGEVRPAVTDTLIPPTCFRPLRLNREFLHSSQRQNY